ncbi:MAG: hypothetical protein WCB15_11365 [Desulfobacterales bacterium]|jgi:hypothetical protein
MNTDEKESLFRLRQRNFSVWLYLCQYILPQRLEAGANVVTSIVPPGRGLAGVARHSLDIEEGKRTIASVEEILPACGLRPASAEKYLSWIRRRREALGKSFNSILSSIVA